MSMPSIVHPWSAPSPILTEVRSATVQTDLAPIASALFAAGFTASAIALADTSTEPAVQAMAETWRQTVALDASVAGMISAGAGPIIPSVTTRPDGSPQFVVQFDDAGAAVDALSREHGDNGVQSELRLFLGDALQGGDRYVDAAPGAGFAALSAATGDAAVSVIVLCDSIAQHRAIEASARLSDATDCLTARVAESLDDVPFTPAARGGTTILHAGGAGAVAGLLTGARGALERREIGAVAWRCGRSDDTDRDAESLQIAAAVLGVFGFQHFALAQGADGIELVPAEAMASNEMIFSLEPSFLARFAT